MWLPLGSGVFVVLVTTFQFPLDHFNDFIVVIFSEFFHKCAAFVGMEKVIF
jgi:hypothetical protein